MDSLCRERLISKLIIITFTLFFIFPGNTAGDVITKSWTVSNQSEWEEGTFNNIDTSMSPGDLILSTKEYDTLFLDGTEYSGNPPDYETILSTNINISSIDRLKISAEQRGYEAGYLIGNYTPQLGGNLRFQNSIEGTLGGPWRVAGLNYTTQSSTYDVSNISGNFDVLFQVAGFNYNYETAYFKDAKVDALEYFNSGVYTSQWYKFHYDKVYFDSFQASQDLNGQTITWQFRSSYYGQDYNTTAWYSNISQVPPNFYLQVRATLTSSTPYRTPEIKSFTINASRNIEPFIFARASEAMVVPSGWLVNPSACHTNLTQSPVGPRTIDIVATPLTDEGFLMQGQGPLDVDIYNSRGAYYGSITLEDNDNDGQYNTTYLVNEPKESGIYLLKLRDYPGVEGIFSVINWGCLTCHREPQTPSTFDKTAVHNIHKDTRNTQGNGCGHSQGYYGYYCTACHYESGSTFCWQCHGDYSTGIMVYNFPSMSYTYSVLGDNFGKDVHAAMYGDPPWYGPYTDPCQDCHGNLWTIDPSPSCDNPSCHPLPGSDLTNIPTDISSTSHSLSQEVPCGTCHRNNHDISRAPDCSDCHKNFDKHNNTVDCSLCHDIDPHILKILDINATYKQDRTAPATCFTCHQGTTADEFLYGNGYGSSPTISILMNHSNGSKWGSYWIDNSHESPCDYCHGDTKHSSDALGFVRAGLDDPWNIVNGTVAPNQHWCAGCHLENYSFYYGDTLDPVPPGIEINGSYYPSIGTPYDHTNAIAIDNSDSKCLGCHFGPGPSTITQFMHEVKPKKGSCYNCHSIHPAVGLTE